MSQTARVLIGNGVVLTLGDDNRVIEDGAVLVEGRVVKTIGQTAALRAQAPGAEFIDAHGGVIMPGFVCAHHHLYSTFACGISCAPSANFVEILEHLWWKLDRALTMEDVRLSALIPVARAIKAGTTTLIDHHASPSAIRGSLDCIADVVLQAGIRASLCYEVTDRNGAAGTDDGIAESAAFCARARADTSGRLHALVGLHAGMTISPGTLDRCVDLAHRQGTGLHMHVAEDQADQIDSLKKYQARVIQRLKAAGGLGRDSLAIHCIHLADEELDLLRETDTAVVHNPQSNMNNAVGAARVLDMVKRGIRVGLGTDGMTSDMKEEVRAALWLRHHEHRDPRVGFVEVAEMLVKQNPAIASRFFGAALGRLAVGAPADLIVSDHVPFTPISPANVLGHLLFGVCAAPVDTTIVDGRVLMRDQQLRTLDWVDISRQARAASPATWRRFATL
ncbi:MAG: putative aminohydrolase SsnA [Deltaproteobacteria bacterium]|nr:putative aminohydrolase SsnA [Deltaproteobacteria bacterium]